MDENEETTLSCVKVDDSKVRTDKEYEVLEVSKSTSVLLELLDDALGKVTIHKITGEVPAYLDVHSVPKNVIILD